MSSSKGGRYQSLEDPTSSSSGKKELSGGERSSKSMKVVSVLLIVALFTIIGLAIYVGVKKEKSNQGSGTSTTICDTQACVGMAGEIVRKINTSADPCTNFYEYACGSWIANTIRPDYIGRLSTFSDLATLNHERLRNELTSTPTSNESAVGKASQFYATCMDTNNLVGVSSAPVQDMINDLGGWNRVQESITPVLIRAITSYASFPFFKVFVSRDQKNTSRYLYHINQGGTVLPSSYYTINSSNTAKIQSAYHTLLATSLPLFGGTADFAEDIYAIEHELANASASIVELRDPETTYNKMNISQLKNLSPKIAWLSLLGGLLPEPLSPGDVTESTEVIIQNPSFLKAVSDLLERYTTTRNKQAITNYMVWKSLVLLMLDMDHTAQAAYNTFQQQTAGTQPLPRSQFCVGKTDSGMGYATGRLFVDKYFSSDTRDEAKVLVKEIKKSFKDNLPHVTWMDKATQAKAAEKVDAVEDLIGYPDFIKNDTLLDERYEQLAINETCHFCNVYKANALKGEHNRRMLFDKPIHEFEMTADTVNAYYEPPENIIVFPAGILQPPFYQKDGPKALSYGGIGSVVGHELTHGFDDKGSQFDKDGNLKEWWTPSVREAFRQRTQCVSRQYSKYSLYGVHVNGNQTLGENIADHGGIKMAYNAFQRQQETHTDMTLPSGSLNFNNDQLFFIAFAQVWCEKSSKESVLKHLQTDVHSPHMFRVIGTLSDFAPFSEVFKCSSGSKMNPKEKCPVW